MAFAPARAQIFSPRFWEQIGKNRDSESPEAGRCVVRMLSGDSHVQPERGEIERAKFFKRLTNIHRRRPRNAQGGYFAGKKRKKASRTQVREAFFLRLELMLPLCEFESGQTEDPDTEEGRGARFWSGCCTGR